MLCLKWNVPDSKTPCDKVLAKLSLTFGTGSERRNNRLGKNSLLNCSPDSTFSSNRFWQSCAYLQKIIENVLRSLTRLSLHVCFESPVAVIFTPVTNTGVTCYRHDNPLWRKTGLSLAKTLTLVVHESWENLVKIDSLSIP